MTNIPIFFASDDNYIPYLAVTLASIEHHASDKYIYDIKILTSIISPENRKRLSEMNLPHLRLEIVNINELVKDVRSNIRLRLRDYYSESIFYRIFIPGMFPELKRAIYLDADIILCDDIAKLYFTDIGDNILGAVRDECIAPVPEFSAYVERLLGTPAGIYFNSGVLLINAEKFREERIAEKLLYLLESYNFPTIAPDQDYLNFLTRGKVYLLEHGWNKQPGELELPDEEIHLLHFNMFKKPWHYDGVKYESYFWEAARKTDFYGQLFDEKQSYTEERKLADLEGYERLLGLTRDIMDARCSFGDAIGFDYFENLPSFR